MYANAVVTIKVASGGYYGAHSRALNRGEMRRNWRGCRMVSARLWTSVSRALRVMMSCRRRSERHDITPARSRPSPNTKYRIQHVLLAAN